MFNKTRKNTRKQTIQAPLFSKTKRNGVKGGKNDGKNNNNLFRKNSDKKYPEPIHPPVSGISTSVSGELRNAFNNMGTVFGNRYISNKSNRVFPTTDNDSQKSLGRFNDKTGEKQNDEYDENDENINPNINPNIQKSNIEKKKLGLDYTTVVSSPYGSYIVPATPSNISRERKGGKNKKSAKKRRNKRRKTHKKESV